MRNQHFDISFCITQGAREHLFLSITSGFEHGPGIQRDGISSPRMTDPHSVAAVVNSRKLDSSQWQGIELPATTNAFVQRAGTWTLYHHLKEFCRIHGKRWRIIGVQSNGDLTMNYWHVAYLQRESRGTGPILCGLRTNNDPQEPIGQRTYRALCKWKPDAAKIRKRTYECLDIKFEPLPDERWTVKLVNARKANEFDAAFSKLPGYERAIHDIGPLLEFALAGKAIVERGVEIPFSNAIDRFEDIRHVFNLPTVNAVGHYHGNGISAVNLGEFQLFRNLNERRAALSSPIVINLDIDGYVTSQWRSVRETLRERHYTEISDSPTRRGQFREYTEGRVEIFFPHNVYPFGVLGIRTSEQDQSEELVGLSSGGLSGRVGNTLEGITQIMFDFFGCSDAIVLDEGFDVFALRNSDEEGQPMFSNEELLKKVCAFCKTRLDLDASDAKKVSGTYPLGDDMKKWPLNLKLVEEIENDYKSIKHKGWDDVMLVPPLRSQMRSVLIFAVEEQNPQASIAPTRRIHRTPKKHGR